VFLHRCAVALLLTSLCCTSNTTSADDSLKAQAKSALKQAASFYHNKVALRGGYVYYYSPDLTRRLGEGVASDTQIWVQPPGTPTVGLAYLTAYRATADRFYLDAATQAAEALVYGQLQSGAWTNSIDFDPRSGKAARYRNGRGGGSRARNFSTLDDGISQSAIRLLVQVDQAHGFKHKKIHDAAEVALKALLEAQFPNGGFPQGWDETPAPRPQPVKANFPNYDWRTEGRIKNYWDMFTLNDGLAGTVADTLRDAYRVYKDEKYKDAVEQLGDFLILAQLPAPQPIWSQQYNYDMQPIWARRFEPSAVTGGESQDVMETLMAIYRLTGNKKYLAPIPSALAHLKQSRLSDGRLARYYELLSNKPLYMFRRGKSYTLTYDDSQLPKHYGWKIDSRLDEIEREFQRLKREGTKPAPTTNTDQLEAGVRETLKSLNSDRWISTFSGEPLAGQPKFRPGDKYISSGVFSRNVELLSRYLSTP
jgi:hypothetical protein